MKKNRNFAFKAFAVVAPGLFVKESLKPSVKVEFKPETTAEQRDIFNLIVDRARILSDGAGAGTPYHLQKEREAGTLAKEHQSSNIIWSYGEKMTCLFPDKI